MSLLAEEWLTKLHAEAVQRAEKAEAQAARYREALGLIADEIDGPDAARRMRDVADRALKEPTDGK